MRDLIDITDLSVQEIDELIATAEDIIENKPKYAHVCAGKNHSNMLDMSPSTRKLFSYVPQGNTMFSGTIAENMRNVKQDATDEEIIEALKLACAWDFVEKLPDGIESVIKERGGGFSEGTPATKCSACNPTPSSSTSAATWRL